MHLFAIIVGILLLLSVLLDAFETVVLPRRVRRQFRITSWFYRNTWRPWAKLTSHIKSQTRRESFFGYFGPLSMIVLLGLWASGLIFAFALLQYGGTIPRHAQDQLLDRLEISDRERTKPLRPSQCRLGKKRYEECGENY